jgi:hypothetical protein
LLENLAYSILIFHFSIHPCTMRAVLELVNCHSLAKVHNWFHSVENVMPNEVILKFFQIHNSVEASQNAGELKCSRVRTRD